MKTDNEIKEDCLQEAGIDLGRYSYTEITQIKEALSRYYIKLTAPSKLKQRDETNT
jgi:hypothetical protein